MSSRGKWKRSASSFSTRLLSCASSGPKRRRNTRRRSRSATPPKPGAASASAKAVQEATAKAQADSSAREELLKREFVGERNVLTTRIASLEQTAKEQSAQILKFSQQAEKAYSQVQDIAVQAIEGSSNFKSLTSLQQLLAEQGRKPGAEK